MTDPEAARDAAKGASVIYQCLNAPYQQWPELFHGLAGRPDLAGSGTAGQPEPVARRPAREQPVSSP